MAIELSGRNDVEKLQNLSEKTHKEQAVWFLNAFWEDFAQNQSENIWDCAHKFAELDPRKAEGNGLDEFFAHRFLELRSETLTVHAMRDKLRSVGAISPTDRPKLVPLSHYLVWKYDANFHLLVNAIQGSKEEIARAQKVLDDAQAAIHQAQAAEQEARQREAEARQRVEELRVAKIEQEAALAEVKALEDAFNRRTEELTAASKGTAIVAANRAKNELAQHLSSDPLPLRRAKITLEAAVKKTERAHQAAIEAQAQAEEATVRAAAALEEAQRRLEEAEEYFERAKRSLPHGSVWWMERELHEAKAYMPTARGGYAKKKAF